MITLWIVRHGRTAWNEERRYQGHSDIPLNEHGQQQAHQIAARLAEKRLHAIISSDLSRATRTAGAIAAHHDLPVQGEPGLREANFGVFEGLTYKDVMDQHRTMAEAWFADPEQPPEGGEALSAVDARVREVMRRIITEYERKKVVIVGHDGSLRILLTALLGMPPTEYWRFNLDPCSLTRVNVYPGGAILIRLNDIHHLA